MAKTCLSSKEKGCNLKLKIRILWENSISKHWYLLDRRIISPGQMWKLIYLIQFKLTKGRTNTNIAEKHSAKAWRMEREWRGNY